MAADDVKAPGAPTGASGDEGPTGAILRDLPSPYLPDPVLGLLHLPRFLAKIRKHLAGALPKSYQRNFCRGFDRFLCLHLGIDPEDVVALVEAHGADDAAILGALRERLPGDVDAPRWNRELVQKGMGGLSAERLAEVRAGMGAADRDDLRSFADVIEFDEGRLQ